MKAVDIIAEFPDFYLFVEVKQYPKSYDPEDDWGAKDCLEIDCAKRTKHGQWLKNYLKYKYRDTFLYRFAQNKVEKPVWYLCLLDNLDNALLSNMRDNLQREIPLINKPKRWSREIISQCHCLNMNRWNTKYSQWPVRKVAAT